MHCTDFVALMNHIAPLELAESWDNVGVLLQREERPVERVMLTIDVNAEVVAEALDRAVDAIVSYHPPIFAGLKRIVAHEPKGKLVAQLLHAGVLVYSPHTALDTVVGGVNDWLTEAFPTSASCAIAKVVGANDPRLGQGRIADLSTPLSLTECITRIKHHLAVPHVRVSRAAKHEHTVIHRVAVCAGAGGAVLTAVSADLLLTGEMRHHDILEHRARGVSVILTDHTNTERGYLPVLKRKLAERAPELSILISHTDADPLVIV
jgi:dinuclear metal center YbgI/SA1388 family protein